MKRVVLLLSILLSAITASPQQVSTISGGVQTRQTPVTNFALSGTDTTEVRFDLRNVYENGLCVVEIALQQADDCNVWFCSANLFLGWITEVDYTDWVQVTSSALTFSDTSVVGPINITHLQQLELVDETDYSVGYVPGCRYFVLWIASTDGSPATNVGKAQISFK